MCFERLILIAVVLAGGNIAGTSQPKWDVWLQQLAEAKGIVARGEAVPAWSFSDRVALVRTWTKEFQRCPPLADADRLPHKSVRKRNLKLAENHLAWVEAKCKETERGPPLDYWLEWQRSAHICCTFWALVNGDNLNPTNACRRRFGRWQLAEIRDLVGREAYNRGDWPNPYPLEYFKAKGE